MSRPTRSNAASGDISLSIGRGQLTVHKGDLLALKTDALVCPVDPTLNMQTGLAGLVAKAAGDQLLSQRPVVSEPFGKVIVLPAGQLRAKYVFFTVLLGERGLDKMKVSIRQAVERSIRYAEFLRLKSIAFPILGDARTAPPFDFVAHEMIQNVQSYFQRRQPKLKAVLFSVLNSDAFAAFEREARGVSE